MLKRLPFFGVLSPKSPMNGLIEHYTKITEGIDIIKEAMECYIADSGVCKEFQELTNEIDSIEKQADKIKRNIRNHLPRRLFMAVDKTLFLNYTRSQDNVLDAAQEAMHWLGMRHMVIPEKYQKPLIDLLGDVTNTAEILEPALKSTIGLVHGEHLDRTGTKEKIRTVRKQRHKVIKIKNAFLSEIFNSEMEFKDIYQLIHFVECLNTMVKNCETCADTLRAMIAR